MSHKDASHVAKKINRRHAAEVNNAVVEDDGTKPGRMETLAEEIAAQQKQKQEPRAFAAAPVDADSHASAQDIAEFNEARTYMAGRHNAGQWHRFVTEPRKKAGLPPVPDVVIRDEELPALDAIRHEAAEEPREPVRRRKLPIEELKEGGLRWIDIKKSGNGIVH
jgi:hypothetical protein